MNEFKPPKPLLVYDGDCGFCRLWIEYWKSLTTDSVDYETSQNIAPSISGIQKSIYDRSVVLIMPDGAVYTGAEAVFRSLSVKSGPTLGLKMYQGLPGFAFISQALYGFVASHRVFASKTTRFLWGTKVGPHNHTLTISIFYIILGLVYLVAFGSLWTQIPLLIGTDGILPADIYMEAAKINHGSSAYYKIPTLAWINNSDSFLSIIAILGMVSSLFVILRRCVLPALFVCWLCYLSLVSVGQVFTSFQWDNLLLETGLVAVLLSLAGLYGYKNSVSMIVIWLGRFLLFRLMFSSGYLKLASGDPVWSDLTALSYHYMTQPLPTPTAWFVHHLPLWFHKLSAVIMLVIEIVVPFFIFTPRRPRIAAGIVLIGLQVMIFITGNYTFFNILSIGLVFLLFDDTFLRSFIPSRFRNTDLLTKVVRTGAGTRTVVNSVVVIVATFIFLLGLVQLGGVLVGYRNLPDPLIQSFRAIYPYRIVNGYGLFTVMTTERLEIVLEGSRDGSEWREYEFKHKPGGLDRGLGWVAPHQPRVDWQMWFAALSSYRQNPWLVNMVFMMLEGSEQVKELFSNDPFPDTNPKYIRASLYSYEFTDPGETKENNRVWKREPRGFYLPPLSLDMK